MKQALYRAQHLIKQAKEISPDATEKVIEALNQIVNFDSRMPIMRVMLHVNNIAAGNVLETKEKTLSNIDTPKGSKRMYYVHQSCQCPSVREGKRIEV